MKYKIKKNKNFIFINNPFDHLLMQNICLNLKKDVFNILTTHKPKRSFIILYRDFNNNSRKYESQIIKTKLNIKINNIFLSKNHCIICLKRQFLLFLFFENL